MKLCTDSRDVKPGDVFFCLKGMETDGHKYAAQAAERGAAVIVHQDVLSERKEGVRYIKAADTLHALNKACDQYFDHVSQKMMMFGVTGTNGKSTTVNLIRQIYDAIEPCGSIGTISISFRNHHKSPDLTTPDSVTLHKELRTMYEEGARAAAIEVSSHGLSMGRVDSIDFDYGIFTNLTHDHLDYHKTMENYFEAKKILFKNLKPEGTAVINTDDSHGEELARCTRARCITFGIKGEADYRAEDIQYDEAGTSFILLYNGKPYPFKTNLVAEHNVYNLLGAIAAVHDAGMNMEEIQKIVEHIEQIPGRLERIEEGQPFRVIVDYAHTPDGFEKVLQYAKSITACKGKVRVVFGAAGKRDKSKRRILGAIASKYGDQIYLTEQDVRNESAQSIAEQIKEGIDRETEFLYIENRKDAIREAIYHAEPHDCVLLLGKGDEPFLYDAHGRIPWMGDDNASREAIRERIAE